MPSFRLFRRGSADKPDEARTGPAAPSGRPVAGGGIAFDALTEEWHLRGVMRVERRLSDVLNKRESIPITDVSWAPADGSGPFAPVPGLQAVDPYDLIVVITNVESLPTADEASRVAARLHKVPYDVALDAPPFRVVGTVHLFPGTEPERLMERQTELFVAVTDARIFYAERQLGEGNDVALVNRSYLRGVQQVDKETLEKVRPLPGQPLGGISYRSNG
jgi:hypothetical protein